MLEFFNSLSLGYRFALINLILCVIILFVRWIRRRREYRHRKTVYIEYYNDKINGGNAVYINPAKKRNKTSLLLRIWAAITCTRKFLWALVVLYTTLALTIAVIGFVVMVIWGISGIEHDTYWKTLMYIVKNLAIPLTIVFMLFCIILGRQIFKSKSSEEEGFSWFWWGYFW